VQTQGSLQESDLASLLQTMQSERATGTLTLEDGSDSCSLFFLFGHLFHATAPDGDGEDVVLRALSWHDGSFRFDPRAKLPAEETIKSSPAELIATAEGTAEAPVAVASGTAPSLRAIEGQAASTGSSGMPEPAIWSPAPTPEATTESTGSWSPRRSEEAGQAASVDPWTPATPAQESAPTYAPAEYSPTSVPGAPAFPASPAWAPQATSVGSLPIPSGHIQYEGLKSAFVDFPRLLRTLRTDRHTGFIRLITGADSGVLLFRDGELVEAEAGPDGSAHGEEAFSIFRRRMDTGEGLLDVVELDSDTVTSIARLLTGPPLFAGLLARFVNFPALLEYLSEEKLDGSVIVVGGSQTGVILLKQGDVLAAYTAESPTAQTGTDEVAALASERPARIEVRGDDTSREGIDAEAVLSRPS